MPGGRSLGLQSFIVFIDEHDRAEMRDPRKCSASRADDHVDAAGRRSEIIGPSRHRRSSSSDPCGEQHGVIDTGNNDKNWAMAKCRPDRWQRIGAWG